MAGAGVIDQYVTDLDGRLRGGRRAKLELLSETRDSLRDAAECYREAGLCDNDAERKAVRDFGPVVVIARDYQAELAAAYGVRTLWSILFVLPVVQLLWEATRVGPTEAAPTWSYPFAQVNNGMTWAVAAATALALVVGRLWARRTADNRLIARCAAGVSVAAIGGSALTAGALVVATAIFDPHRLFVSPVIFVLSLVGVAAVARLAVMARRTARFCA
ncbi:permease prefix domain 1-containing protein [Kibdelosporangium lantanae]